MPPQDGPKGQSPNRSDGPNDPAPEYDFSKILGLGGLIDGYFKGKVAVAPESLLPLGFTGPTHQAFARLALEKEFCKPEDVSKIVHQYADRPDFFEHMNAILANRDAKFASHGDFYYTVTLADKERPLVLRCVELTKDLKDPKVFDATWKVIHSRRFEAFLDSDAKIKAFVAYASSVATRFFAVLPDEHFSDYHYKQIGVVLDCSKEPAHDLLLVANFKLGRKESAEVLKRYYADGHHFISHPHHPDYFGPDSLSGKSPSAEEITLRDHLAKLEHYPPLSTHDQLVQDLLRVKPTLREALVDVIGSFCRDKLDFEYFRTLLDCVSNGSGEAPALQQIMQTLPNYRGNELVVAILILEDLVRGNGGALNGAVEHYKQRDLATLEQQMYRRRLEEHAQKFPEKPLPEVRAAFLTREHQDSEVIDEGRLDHALAKYNRILSLGEELVHLSKAEVSVRLRGLCASNLRDEDRDKFQIQFFALTRELFKHQFGAYPYNTQLIAILLMTSPEPAAVGMPVEQLQGRGVYSQIKTGEGKSLIISLSAAYLAVQGRNVDIITSNPYLAGRDALRFKQFYETMGITSGAFDHEKAGPTIEENPSVLYTTNQDLIFAYLSLRLHNALFFNGSRFDVALVDEADNLCIDLTQEACRIAEAAPPLFAPAVFQKFLDFVDRYGHDVILNSLAESVSSFCEYCPEVAQVHPIYLGLYLRSAVQSADHRINRDFVVVDGKIVIVDVDNTGRLKQRTHWANGLHEFITLRNNLTLPEHMGVSAQMNHPTFIRKYKTLLCVSGTFGDETDRAEMGEIYHLTGFDVPTHYASRRQDNPLTLVGSREAWLQMLGKWADEYAGSSAPRPLLVIAESIEESIAIHQLLTARGHSCQLLNDYKNLDENGAQRKEDEIIRRAGRAGLITVATSVAGRGADIIPDEQAKAAGGVHSLLTFIPMNKRVEYQARGRSGRQGAPGSSEILACAETDSFIASLPPPSRQLVLGTLLHFGPGSAEVQAAVDFARRAQNIFGSFHRRIMLDKDELVQRALENYFSSLAGVAEELAQSNRVFHQHRDSGLASYVASLYLSERWTQEFDQFDNALRYQHLFGIESQGTDSLQGSIDESKASIALEGAFRRSFGASPGETGDYDEQFMDQAAALFEIYRRALNRQQILLQQLDNERVERLVDDLAQKVGRMTQDCVAAFKSSSEFDIKRFLDEKERKRKEREKGEGSGTEDR